MTRLLSSLKSSAVAMVAVAGLVSMIPADADACSFAGPEIHTLDAAEQAVDVAPPGAPTLLDLQIVRGQGPQSAGCGGSSATSCDDIGQIRLNLVAADDRTDAARIGYRISLAGGALPSGLLLPDEPIRTFDGWISLIWIDEATDDQERIEFSLTVTAIDLAGNESAPAASIQVDNAGGFLNRAARRGPLLPLAFLIAALAINILRNARPIRRRLPILGNR